MFYELRYCGFVREFGQLCARSMIFEADLYVRLRLWHFSLSPRVALY